MFYEGLEELHLNQLEYGFLLSISNYNQSHFKMNIPKLMPLISQGTATNINETFDVNIFVNDNDCKPSISNSIATQNYLSIPRFTNADFAYRMDLHGYVHPGAKFICCIMDDNIKDIYLTDNI